MSIVNNCCQFSHHSLKQCHLTKSYCEHLAEKLTSSSTNQMDLDLTGNDLKDEMWFLLKTRCARRNLTTLMLIKEKYILHIEQMMCCIVNEFKHRYKQWVETIFFHRKLACFIRISRRISILFASLNDQTSKASDRVARFHSNSQIKNKMTYYEMFRNMGRKPWQPCW